MGHDIKIVDRDTNIVVDTTYISGNFNSLVDDYNSIYEMHGHKGLTVARIAFKVMLKLSLDGVKILEPDQLNPNWYWGLHENGHVFDLDAFKSVYMWHMKKFLELGFNHPHCIFMSDQVGTVESIKFDDGYISDGYDFDDNNTANGL